MPGPPHELDLALLRAARRAGHSPRADALVARFSALGEHGELWVAVALTGAALDPARRRRWVRAARVVALAYLANQAVKLAVRRRRPELADLPPLTATRTRLSFPSAHATTSFAGARALAGLLPTSGLYGLAVAVAASRVWLGVHYPSDVAAGALLGTLVAGAAP